MPRGTPKRGQFKFTIWFAGGSRVEWESRRSQTDAEIASAIRRYLLPVAERIEAVEAVNAGATPSAEGVTESAQSLPSIAAEHEKD
jgi:hypothetical protein